MSGSRRESRSSLGNRQNDALFEHENFKKKFLLANKHITKLNSTLSVRIEELNAQISMLCVENLRLRASEIALASQLKREREQSRKVLADAEAASQNLTKHLCHLRESFNTKRDSGVPPTPLSPKARRPIASIGFDPVSPQFRIARPPNVPGIHEEEEEPCASAVGENEHVEIPQRKKSKTKSKLIASKLTIPASGALLTPRNTGEVDIQHVDLSASNGFPMPKKSIRRQSGLLKVSTESLAVPRSGSPAFGSPIRLEAALAEEKEEIVAMHHEFEVVVKSQEESAVADKKEKEKEKRKGKFKEQCEYECEEAPRERKRPKDSEGPSAAVKVKSSLRAALQPIDSNVEETCETEVNPPARRQFLRPLSPQDPLKPVHSEGAAGRERRVRKSVNYAEPKLNTKMRKPDPQPGSESSQKKRSSAAAVMSTAIHKSLPLSSMDVEGVNTAASETETTSSLDCAQSLDYKPLPLRGVNGNYINPENFPIPDSRPGSAAAMYSPSPPTRTTGSTTSSSSVTTADSSSSVVVSAGSTEIKRKMSRPQLHLSDGDSDGADADAEYVSSNSGHSSGPAAWGNMNIDSVRRRGLPRRSAASAAVAALEDIRRHSMVV